MKKIHLSVGKNKNIIFCVAAGLFAALAVSFAITFALTKLIETGKLNEKGFADVFLTRVIATVTGGLVGAGLADKKHFPVVIATSAAYLAVLLALGLLLFDGSIYRFWIGVISVVSGAVITLLIKMKPQTKRNKAVRRIK